MYATTHCALRNYVSESKCLHLEIWLSWNRLFLRNMLFVRSNKLWWCRTLSLWFSPSSHNGHSWKGALAQKGILQCNITTLYMESKPTSHGSHERESIVVFDKVLAQLVEQIQNFTQIQFNTLPLWEGFSELAFALDMNRIGENQSCQYLITSTQRTFHPAPPKKNRAKLCNVCA